MIKKTNNSKQRKEFDVKVKIPCYAYTKEEADRIIIKALLRAISMLEFSIIK